MVERGWMVVTGAGGGIMGATQQGAGREQSFGLNIRLPFEQEANPWIADDPKLITFKYFFTRKLFLVKEASAVALFPGGFGTMDETFELLTLMQTGKAAIVPVVLLEAAAKPYWRILDRWTSGTLAERGLIEGDHTSFYRIVDSVEEAVAEITGFYRASPSSRIVGGRLVLRLTRALAEAQLAELQGKFGGVLEGAAGPGPGPRAPEGEGGGGPGSRRAGGERVPGAAAADPAVQPRVLRAAAPADRLRQHPLALLRLGPLLGRLALGADPGAEHRLGLAVAPEGPRDERGAPAPRAPRRPGAGRQGRGKPGDFGCHRPTIVHRTIPA